MLKSRFDRRRRESVADSFFVDDGSAVRVFVLVSLHLCALISLSIEERRGLDEF